MYETRKSNCAERISLALSIRKMKQIELCEKTNIPKSAMSQYIKGSFEPKQDRIFLLAQALNVNEAWLMGYDVPMERGSTNHKETESPVDVALKNWLDSATQDEKMALLNLLKSINNK